ncbi:cell wall metabolism sensor histidine kinase WalK [Paenibacillus sp. N1-5-1-14]|uniref:sensor histidine kinase n=1 Tax=Paenibacillus radicibacter TaxID=2972488 RepID=UPI00215950AE|nr:cell wall metabolism sensor histidine kinase WalK [Paenibacillus radicibacter]MCR8645674.1 cell wall metabolism sensor histidine kinase WalK [Paenibacillus radicibacter]
MNSIKGRVVWKFVIIIFVVVVLMGGMFTGMTWQYYYGSASHALNQKADISVAFYNKYLESSSLLEKARYILDNSPVNDETRTEILDPYGGLIIDSYGFQSKEKLTTPDVKSALKGDTGQWIGINKSTGERILALSKPLKKENTVIGVVRYTTSMELIDETVRLIVYITIGVGIAIILLAIGGSIIMANQIVRPIQELTQVAKTLADGNFEVKAIKRQDDEIGHLAETLNYMSSEIQKNDQIKSEFISSISHELRTPLTSIKGWNETLVSGGMDDKEEISEGLNVISKETDRLIGLVENLLDFSKLHGDTMTLHYNDLNMNQIVTDIGSQFIPTCTQKQINLQLQMQEGMLLIEGDMNRLKQVFVNLLDNAIKFTPAGGTITIITEQVDKLVTVQVKDTGIGIPPEKLRYVTDKFYKAGTLHAGSGLGLSISKELTRLHGGKLHIASKWGEGTTVTLEIPALDLEELGLEGGMVE